MPSMHVDVQYAALLAVRLVCIASPGYIHPDELFQSIEPAAVDVFGIAGFIPWETADCSRTVRSALVIDFPAGVVYRLLHWLVPGFPFCPGDARWMVFAPRLLLFLVSIITDALIADVARVCGGSGRSARWWLATSWAHAIMSCRSLSNALEGVILAFCIWALARLRVVSVAPPTVERAIRTCETAHRFLQAVIEWRSTHGAIFYAAALGALAVLGVFVRFTFAGYAAVLAAASLAVLVRSKLRVMDALSVALFAASAALGCAAILLAYDNYRFTGFSLYDLRWSTVAVAPWNMAVYNSDASNFVRHGINPRWTHLVINGFIMFGPLWLWAYVLIARSRGKPAASTASGSFVGICVAALVVVQTALLSTAPHQEPRFLAPLVFPLAVLVALVKPSTKTKVLASDDKPGGAGRAFKGSWCVWNAAVGWFFAFMHQGGVLPVLDAASDILLQAHPACAARSWHVPPQYLSSLSRRVDALPAGAAQVTRASQFVLQGRDVYIPPLSFLRIPASDMEQAKRMRWCERLGVHGWVHPGKAFAPENVRYIGEAGEADPAAEWTLSVATTTGCSSERQKAEIAWHENAANQIAVAGPQFSGEATGISPASYAVFDVCAAATLQHAHLPSADRIR